MGRVSDLLYNLGISPENYRLPGGPVLTGIREIQDRYTYDFGEMLRVSYYQPYLQRFSKEMEAGWDSPKPRATCVEVEQEVRKYLQGMGYVAFPVEVCREVYAGVPAEQSGRLGLKPGHIKVYHQATFAVGNGEWFIANSISPSLKQAVFSYEDFQGFKSVKLPRHT